jgi:hypothetical protein
MWFGEHEKLGRFQNTCPGILSKPQQILVASHNVIRMRSLGALEYPIVVRVLFDYVKLDVWSDVLGHRGKKLTSRFGLCQRPVKSLLKNSAHLVQDWLRNLQAEYLFFSKLKKRWDGPR